MLRGESAELESIVAQMMVLYQKKYSIISELYRLTEELAQMLSYNDHVSTQMILNMRHDEMSKADECSVAISVLEESMGPEERAHLHGVLHGGASPATFEEKKVLELYQSIQSTLIKTIEIDKRASLKIAGKDSAYLKNDKSSVPYER